MIGSGKSTLLNEIVKMIDPSLGSKELFPVGVTCCCEAIGISFLNKTLIYKGV